MTKKAENTWTVFLLAALTVSIGVAPASSETNGQHRKKRMLVTFQEGTSRAERERAAKNMGLKLSDDFDSIQVSILEAAGDVTVQDVSTARQEPNVVAVEEDEYRNWLLEAPVSFQSTPLPSVEALLQLAGRQRSVPSPAPARGGEDSALPADGTVPWGVARVNAPAAWSSGQGAGVKVAVIDTGIDCTHPDLQCDFSAGTNIINPGSKPMDDNKHGTHVAGTIAGRGNGSTGVLGVAPKAALIPIKVMDSNGNGSTSDIINGINWATTARVNVINLSIGGPTGSVALERAVEKAIAAGIVVVCSAGNSGPTPNTVAFPAGYPGVIAVAASDDNDKVASFSSRGDAVSFIAPGVDITSTVPGGGYAKLSGTSMASPHVAGLAALAVERGAKGQNGVRAAFSSAASPLSGLAATDEGAGMIDAAKLR
jgi:subtilisin